MPESSQPTPEMLEKLKGKKLLLIEDEQTCIDILQKLLMLQGEIELTVCSDGEEALQALDILTYQPETFPIDGVIFDLNLPKVSGYELIPMFREARPDLPIVVATASRADTKKEQGIKAMTQGYVTKPYNFGTLLTAVYYSLYPEPSSNSQAA